MPLDRLSEEDRSRLAQLIRGPVIPPATPPKSPPPNNWSAEMWKTGRRYTRSRWDSWSTRWRQLIAGSAAGMACLTLLALCVQLAARRDTHAIPIELQEHQGQLQIRWAAGSDLIRHAREAKLFITDGADRLFVTLDAARLRRGTVSYARQSERVEVRMALTEPDGHMVEQQAVFFGAPLDREESHPGASSSVVPTPAAPRDPVEHRSRRKPLVQTGTHLPFTCSTGDTFRKTDAPPGWDTFTCRGNNVWGVSRTHQEQEHSAHRPAAKTSTT